MHGSVVQAAHVGKVEQHFHPAPTARSGGGVGVAEAAEHLAQAVGVQWRREEERQRIHDPFPLPVRWHPAPEALTDHWANIRRAPAGLDPGPLALDGRLDRVIDVYRRIPSGRLVVLGQGGSGKTILTLRFVLDLLDARTDTDRIPVIFGLGSWNPTTTSLRDWLTDQLLRDHPGLAAPGPTGSTLAAALVQADRVLPVLDGFDEIADGLHHAALQALNATGMPLLLTSRPDEYATAVANTDVLTAAAGIELDDLTLTDLVDYLPRTTRRTTHGGTTPVWDPVLARLRDHPGGPGESRLTAVLSSPLMVAHARIIYSDTLDRDPGELLDTTRFGTTRALEEHLTGGYLRAAYENPPQDRDSGRRRHRQWDPDRVHHWLGYLASHLDQLGTHDLAWWQLGNTLTRPTRMLVGGLVFGLAAALAGALANGLAIWLDLLRIEFGWGVRGHVIAFAFAGGTPVWITGGLTSGLMGGLVAGLAFGLRFGLRSEGPEPSRIQLRLRGRAQPALEQLTKGLLFGLAAGLVVGLVALLADLLTRKFVYGLHVERSAVMWFIVLFGLVFGLLGGLAFGLVFGLRAPIDIRAAVSPPELLTANRRNTVFQSFAGWLAFGLAFGGVNEFTGGLGRTFVGGLIDWFSDGLVWGFVIALSTDAWGRWLLLSRIWLPLTGRLPWAVIAFLDDAHQRGVLRQAGAVYQFRHAQLQNHLTHLYASRADRQPARSRAPADRSQPAPRHVD